MVKIKLHTHQRWCKQNLVCRGHRGRNSDPPQETEPDLSLVLVSPAEAWVSSGLPRGQGLWLQQIWEV